jgi:hypothetical protein
MKKHSQLMSAEASMAEFFRLADHRRADNFALAIPMATLKLPR